MRTIKLLSLCGLMGLLLLPMMVMAQDPTDRPFPTRAATATVEATDRPFPAAQATATDRPFPAAATLTVESTGGTDVSGADGNGTDGNGTDVTATPELLLEDVQATAEAAQAKITQLEAERESLLSDIEESETDNDATLFASVIIVIGALLALAVFFGLRRNGA